VLFSTLSDVSMAISNLAQFGLLLWKNWLLQKRRIVVTIFQIIIPVLFAVILLGIRALVPSDFVDKEKIWDSFDASTFPPMFLSKPSTRDNIEASTFPSNLSSRTERSTTSPDDQTSILNVTLFPDPTIPPNLTATQNTTSPGSQTSLLNVTLASDTTSPPSLTATQNTTSSGDLTSLLNVTLPPNTTLPSSLTPTQNTTQNNKWWLVFSPNSSKAAERIANKTAQTLGMMPPVGTSMLFLDLLLFPFIYRRTLNIL